MWYLGISAKSLWVVVGGVEISQRHRRTPDALTGSTKICFSRQCLTWQEALFLRGRDLVCLQD